MAESKFKPDDRVRLKQGGEITMTVKEVRDDHCLCWWQSAVTQTHEEHEYPASALEYYIEFPPFPPRPVTKNKKRSLDG
jgi:uncharacterized protein YodC (DUF2158 family)